MKQKIIGVIGPNTENCTDEIYEFGIELGKMIIDLGFFLVSGGKQGIMEAVSKGARKSANYYKGKVIGIIPEKDSSHANEYVDIVISTGIGLARNSIIANTADIIIAVAGGAGTLSEIAFAWQMQTPAICVTAFDGWSKNLAGLKLDNRSFNLLIPAKSLSEVKEILSKGF